MWNLNESFTLGKHCMLSGRQKQHFDNIWLNHVVLRSQMWLGISMIHFYIKYSWYRNYQWRKSLSVLWYFCTSLHHVIYYHFHMYRILLMSHFLLNILWHHQSCVFICMVILQWLKFIYTRSNTRWNANHLHWFHFLSLKQGQKRKRTRM